MKILHGDCGLRRNDLNQSQKFKKRGESFEDNIYLVKKLLIKAE
ncbi:hypothetical protein T4E_5494 [Trichinella pseudospiralis]|uniref:Uncharacterized protein n=1 Tax=Trichinella pseudospiralis TaxID=6337 RepID=A0A0V0XCQ6_TRIPS|nr:hypothetical protein T4E_5494 [Trichinella pseudospiralis]